MTKKSLMKALLVIAITFLFSCQSKQNLKVKSEQSELENVEDLSVQQKGDSVILDNAIPKSSFFDSISNKNDLTIEQIKAHTKIEDFYYTGKYSEASFTGDSIFNTKTGYKVAIIRYDDKLLCMLKFLLVFDQKTMKSIDCRMIFSECDRDASSEYVIDRYRFINDSIFETIKIFIPPGLEEESGEALKERYRWKIHGQGFISRFP